MWNLKKGHNRLLCRNDTNTDLEKLWFPSETGWGGGMHWGFVMEML